jgi:hypothetical protein
MTGAGASKGAALASHLGVEEVNMELLTTGCCENCGATGVKVAANWVRFIDGHSYIQDWCERCEKDEFWFYLTE